MSRGPSWPFEEGQRRSGLNLIRNSLKMSNPRKTFYEDSDFFSFKFTIPGKTLSKRLPLFLWGSEVNEAIFFLAQHESSPFGGAYNEAGILVRVRSLLGEAYFFLWAVVDCDRALILGRETLGVPKKMATFQITQQGENLSFEILQKGEESISGNLKKGGEKTQPYKIFGNRIVNAGGIGQLFMLQPIWTYLSPEEIIVARHLESDSNVVFSPSLSKTLFETESIDYPFSEGQYSNSKIFNSRFLLPIGFAGPSWLAKNFDLRY